MGDYISREVAKESFENADADVCESYPDGHCDWGFGRSNINDVICGVPRRRCGAGAAWAVDSFKKTSLVQERKW